MTLTYYESTSRGLTATGWLVGKHMFSFGDYLNVQRMRFGSLRVFNDDLVMPGTGFRQHPHDNMEIITVVLQGAVRHEDSMGNTATVAAGEVQTMSAGSGVTHSEMNPSETEALKLLQIWIDTETPDITPAYDQKPYDATRKNEWILLAGPNDPTATSHAIIHQRAYVYHGRFDAGKIASYTLKHPDTHGLFLFIIDGAGSLGQQPLRKGDGLGVREAKAIDIAFTSPTRLILIEMPL